MTGHIKIIAGAAVVLTIGCSETTPKLSAAVQDLGGQCAGASNCGQFAPCVVGGSIQCSGGRCVAVGAQSVDLTCVESSHPSACGVVPQPPEQLAQTSGSGDLGFCRWKVGRPSGYLSAGGWFVAVADTPGSTVEVLQATVYGIDVNGDLTPLSGSGVGQNPIAWAGIYHRQPWFVPGDIIQKHQVTPGASYVGQVPTGTTLLHFGPPRANVSNFDAALVVAKIRTTGDAQVQAGIDYWPDSSTNGTSVEGALGDWVACTTPVTVSTPRGSGGTCDLVTGTEPATIKVTAPTSGANFTLGATLTMAWTSTGIADGDVRLVALQGGTPLTPTIWGTAPANGSHPVVLPLTWPTGSVQFCATTSSDTPSDCVAVTLKSPSPPPSPTSMVITIANAAFLADSGYGTTAGPSGSGQWLSGWSTPAPCAPAGSSLNCTIPLPAGAVSAVINGRANGENSYVCQVDHLTHAVTAGGKPCGMVSNNQGGCNVACNL